MNMKHYLPLFFATVLLCSGAAVDAAFTPSEKLCALVKKAGPQMIIKKAFNQDSAAIAGISIEQLLCALKQVTPAGFEALQVPAGKQYPCTEDIAAFIIENEDLMGLGASLSKVELINAINEAKAYQGVFDLVDTTKPAKKWSVVVEEVCTYLADTQKPILKELCVELRKVQNCCSEWGGKIKISTALTKFMKILPAEIKERAAAIGRLGMTRRII